MKRYHNLYDYRMFLLKKLHWLLKNELQPIISDLDLGE